MGLLRTNSFKLVGRLSNVDMKTGNRKTDGSGYIMGTATVIANIGGRDNEFSIRFSTSQLTKEGKESKLYLSYSKMSELVGKKVQIEGEIGETRFYSVRNNQMSGGNILNGKFIKGVTESTADEATYELGGFIVDTLKEKVNKNNEIYRYDLVLGQANYSENMMSRLVLHVDPADKEIINGVRNYQIGQTVRINGILNFIVTVTTKAADNAGGFGEAPVKTYTNKTSNYFITGGSAAITDVQQGAYPSDVIRSLVNAYKAKDAEIMNKAKENTTAEVEEEPVITSRQTSLI